MKKLSIAIILPSLITKNGTAKQALELAKILKNRGHTVDFYTYAYLEKSSFEELREFHINYCVNVEKSLVYKRIKNVSTLEKYFLYSALVHIKQFSSLLKDSSIDVLNPHDWFGIWVASFANSKASIVANINDVPHLAKGFINDLKLNQDRKNKAKIDKIIVLDNVNKNKVIEWLQIKENKVVVVRSGIDLAKYKKFNKKYNLKKFLHLSNNDSLFVCANLPAPNRRYEDALEAIALLKKQQKIVHLLILGKLDFDITYSTYLKEIVKKNHIEKQVHFIDKFFTDEERMMYIKNSDVLIFPNYPQTWGLTVIEAMALGLPVIVSNGSGVSEVLHEGENAFIFEKQNVIELSEKIEKYMHAKSLFTRVAKNGQQYVLKTFSWEKFGIEIEKLMLESVKKKK